MFATNCQLNYPRFVTRNCWRSIEAHFQDGVGSMLDCFWHERCPLPRLWICATNRQIDYQNAKPTIVDTPLTLIFRIGQGACPYCFCLRRQPLLHLWTFSTNRYLGHPRRKTKTCWHLVEFHVQNGAVTMWWSLLPIKGANMWVIHNSNQITFQLLYLQDQ